MHCPLWAYALSATCLCTWLCTVRYRAVHSPLHAGSLRTPYTYAINLCENCDVRYRLCYRPRPSAYIALSCCAKPDTKKKRDDYIGSTLVKVASGLMKSIRARYDFRSISDLCATSRHNQWQTRWYHLRGRDGQFVWGNQGCAELHRVARVLARQHRGDGGGDDDDDDGGGDDDGDGDGDGDDGGGGGGKHGDDGDDGDDDGDDDDGEGDDDEEEQEYSNIDGDGGHDEGLGGDRGHAGGSAARVGVRQVDGTEEAVSADSIPFSNALD
eukprot:2061360-Rhodomonas_salina.1